MTPFLWRSWIVLMLETIDEWDDEMMSETEMLLTNNTDFGTILESRRLNAFCETNHCRVSVLRVRFFIVD